MRISLQDIPIRWKAFAASIVLLICLVGLGVNAHLTISESADGIKALSGQNLPKQQAVAKLKDDIVATHVGIFRFVSWASNGVNANLLDAQKTNIMVSIDALTRQLDSMANQPDFRQDERDSIAALREKWGSYVRVAKDTIDVGSADAPMGTMMLGMADDEFRNLAQALEKFFDIVTTETRSVASVLARDAEANKRILALGGLAGVLVSLIVTFLVGSSIVRPIQAITKVMREVSSGNLDVDIGFRDRRDEIGQMVRAVEIFRETIERDNRLLNAREEDLRSQNLRFDMALGHMSQGLCMFDAQSRLVVCNERYLTMYGLDRDVVKPDMKLTELVAYRQSQGMFTGDIEKHCSEIVTAIRHGETAQHTNETEDGRTILIVAQPMADGGWVATHEDITERKKAEERIAHMARHDSLTGLANRAVFQEQIGEALKDLRRSGEQFAVFVLDLDQFKAVNDSLGHPIGDALLDAVAKRLIAATRDTDTVARLGGDEFAILQTSSDREPRAAATSLAARLHHALSAPYNLNGTQLIVSSSIGIALAPDDGIEADQLLKNADLALYRTKTEGRNGYHFFKSDMDHAARARHALGIDIRHALSRNEFELHYQTLAGVTTREICGVEALVRWRHPVKGIISPDTFIPLAEESGLIVPLGRWILRTACADAAVWPEHVKVAVNLSPVQFKRDDLLNVVKSALAETGLAADRLEVEIIESVLLQQNEANLAVLHGLRDLGVAVVLDDFGTGYSSLSYLRMFPFDKIKIDRSFVHELAIRDDCAAIVAAITGLGRSLNIVTTAEGVETQEQFELLRAAGCSQVQGYLFSRPCPKSELDLETDVSATALAGVA